MSGTITTWLHQLKKGDREALQNLWEHYFEQLIKLAHHKLIGVPRQMADEEDLALSTINSFFQAVEKKRFPQLENSGDLWQILVVLAGRKAVNLRKYHLRDKRDARKVVRPGDLHASPENEQDSFFLDQIRGGEPDPHFAIEVADQCRHLLRLLPDEQLREIAMLKLEGYTNPEIARHLHCAPSTVDRRLKLIREAWSAVDPNEERNEASSLEA